MSIDEGERQRLLAEVRTLRGASLQKVYLPSPQLCVLQLRVPSRTVLVLVDARLSMTAIAPSRPTAPDSAPRSQATLRNALTGALVDARLEVALDAPRGRAPSVRLSFDGGRSLIAEEGGALLLVAGDGRIVWASTGAGPSRRPGAKYPEVREVPLAETSALPAREALVAAALESEERAGVAARKRELVARAKARAQKLRRTLAAVETDAARAASSDEDRARAELLLPHQARIPRGAKEARLPDWSRADAEGRPAELVVPLDPSLSAAGNAARWLKRAKRYQAAHARIEGRRAEVQRQLAEAEALLARASAAQDAAQLALVDAALGPRREQRGPGAEKARPRLPYRTFRGESGAPILVGRSAKDNDALTFKVARGNDLWLHVRGLQGSHVVLPGVGDVPDARLLGDAALLAAHFSSARGVDAAEVSWTRCKYVRKARGAAAGAVTYSQEKTLRVRVREDRLRALLASEEA